MKTHRHMDNLELAGLFRALASALEIKKKNRFRIIAYQNVAASIEKSPQELKDLWREGKLDQVPGIGKNIAAHLDELFQTGRVKHFDQIFRGLPEAMFKLMEVPGIGPKTAYKLATKLKLNQASTAVPRLKRLAQEGKLRRVEGFGEQSEKDIIQGISEFHQKEDRMLLSAASHLARKILDHLQKSPLVIKAEHLGSLRRQKDTVGDIDIAVATKNPQGAAAYFLKFPEIKKITDQGEKKVSVLLKNGRQVDVRFHPPDEYGSLVQHFTGSKSHNVKLRELALKKGLSLSEYGIKKGKSLKKFASEEKFYAALGLKYIPPELREDRGEITTKVLPKLVELDDIKGDLHVHSDIDIQTSHDLGADSLKNLVLKARSLGYQYLGVADHNPATTNHTSKQIIAIIKARKDKIDKFNTSHENKMKIKVLNLLEVDIKPDGSLAVPEQGLDLLDFALVSIHSSFRQPLKTATQRLLTGLSHPKAKILAHPTARMLNRRPPVNLDWDKIFAFCLKNHKVLEINSSPERLDLPDSLVKRAVDLGVKLAVNTDAHAADQLGGIASGVAVARRGWAEARDVINTLPYAKLAAILNL